jgi:NitT/TauT family transport system substrate-binding protein
MQALKPVAARLAVAALVLAAAADPAAALEKIRFGLNWLPEAEHCGFFYAKAAGLYEKVGLDVDLIPGGPGLNTAILVAGGQEDLAMGSSFTTLNMVKHDVPGVTVAAYFQKDPQTLVAHADQGIRDIRDVKGRPVMVADSARGEFWQFLKARFGFTDDQLRPYTYNPAVFLANPDSIQQGYVTSDALYLGGKLEKPPVILLLADYGYANYATTVFGMRSFTESKPAVVKAFLDATARGWQACMTSDYTPAMKAATAINTDPSYGPALWAAAIAEMRNREIVTGGDAEKLGIGTMTDERWKSFFDDMVAAGVYPPNLDYKSAYTLKFVAAK